MSKKAVEQLVGKMFADERFRRKVLSHPQAALAGFNLTADERARFEQIRWAGVAGTMNKIWNRASLAMGRNLN